MSDDQIGDEGEMPPEMQEHMLAAFAHKAGLGPHPGMYQGPPRRKRDQDVPTDTDRQRAEEEPLEEAAEQTQLSRVGEASAQKMQAARTGGAGPGLGPTEAEQALAKQTQTLQQQAAAAGQAQAAQAQAAAPSLTPPPAPSGPAGVTTPYPAQRKAVGGAGEEQPSQEEAEEGEQGS